MRLLDKENRESLTEFYQKLMDDDFDLNTDEIILYIKALDRGVISTLPQLEKGVYTSELLLTLFDDIQEDEYSSQEEKDQKILGYILKYKIELQGLLKKVIEQTNIVYKQYVVSARASGYCSELIKAT